MTGVISPEAAYRALADHPRWVVERARIYRDIRLPSFLEAMRLINRVAAIAEQRGHHPNITLHEGCFVRLELYSHLAGAMTMDDVELAIALDEGIGDLRRRTDD